MAGVGHVCSRSICCIDMLPGREAHLCWAVGQNPVCVFVRVEPAHGCMCGVHWPADWLFQPSLVVPAIPWSKAACTLHRLQAGLMCVRTSAGHQVVFVTAGLLRQGLPHGAIESSCQKRSCKLCVPYQRWVLLDVTTPACNAHFAQCACACAYGADGVSFVQAACVARLPRALRRSPACLRC